MQAAEEVRAYQRAWRANNKDRIKQYQARPDVKEKRRAYWVARYAERRDEIKAERKGYSAQYRLKNPWKGLLAAAERRAKKSGVRFLLTEAWAQERYTGKCELTGLPFVISGGKKPGPRALSPSIDRIDQSRGYEPGNCRFVLASVNVFRGSMDDQQMLEIASALLKHCSDCGTVHDRDVNAARNILRVGLGTLVGGTHG